MGGAAAATYVGLTLAGAAALVPALNREGDAAAGFLDLRTALIALAFVALAAWLLVVGIHALQTHALPRVARVGEPSCSHSSSSS